MKTPQNHTAFPERITAYEIRRANGWDRVFCGGVAAALFRVSHLTKESGWQRIERPLAAALLAQNYRDPDARVMRIDPRTTLPEWNRWK